MRLDRNLISGNGTGVNVDGSVKSLIQGNLIGTDITGTSAEPNNGIGVEVESGSTGNTIGGAAVGAGNVISGNTSDGVEITGSGTSGNVVAGITSAPTSPGPWQLPTYVGVEIDTSASGNTIGGLTTAPGTGAGNVISGNTFEGVLLSGAGNLVAGNEIGTNAAGTAAIANRFEGVYVINAPDNTVGGTAAGAGNLISGNVGDGVLVQAADATGDLIAGNEIGTNAAGTAAIANNAGVEIDDASGDTIGGTTALARNIISGNTSFGVSFDLGGTGDVVVGSYIGTDVTGDVALPNGGGVNIATSGNTIGGTASGAGNLISGNTSDGVSISGAAATGNLIAGNLIGLNAGGTAAVANASDGVDIEAPDNTVGGTVSGSANVISGNKQFGVIIYGGTNNAPDNLVAGNFIGTNAAGTAAVANSTGVGIENNTGTNTIGGTTAAAHNVISGNANDGVIIFSDAGVIEGNFIGTDLTGQVAVGNAVGVDIYEASGSTIGGLSNTPGTGPGNVISGNTFVGIEIDVSSQNVIEGNILGLQANGSGLIAGSNAATAGIDVGGASTGNVIGGTVSGAANVVSGNEGSGILLNETSGALVAGNLIGTDAGGTLNRGNALQGVELLGSSGDTIGGSTAGTRNIISGNDANGILVENQARTRVIPAYAATNNLIEGNYVGTDVTGAAALGNAAYGVELAYDASGDSRQVTSTSANTIGGTTAGAANVISGNTTGGVEITGSSATGNVVAGDFIGTDNTGTVAIANGTGVEIASSMQATRSAARAPGRET